MGFSLNHVVFLEVLLEAVFRNKGVGLERTVVIIYIMGRAGLWQMRLWLAVQLGGEKPIFSGVSSL